MNATPKYPSTIPVIARPRPFKRPGLLRISESAMYPKITATIERGRMTKRIPQITLKIALPLVSGGSPNATCGSGATPAPACESRPQAPQNRCPSARLLPQPRQNELTGLLLCAGASSETHCGLSYCRTSPCPKAIKICTKHTLHNRLRQCGKWICCDCPWHLGLICCPQWSKSLLD